MRPENYTPARLEALRGSVLAGRWHPRPLIRRIIGGERPREVGIPTLDDQVVSGALRMLLDPALDPRLHEHVWGFRPGRDRHGAIRALCSVTSTGALVRADVRRMFESLEHGRLRAAIRTCWPDPLALALVERMLASWQAGVGVPTGVSISPVLSNAYFHVGLDGWLAAGPTGAPQGSVRAGRWADVGRGLVVREAFGGLFGGALGGPRGRAPPRSAPFTAAMRYADDFALLGPGDGRATLAALESAVGRCALSLHPDKTCVHRVERRSDWPVTVLGYELVPRRVRGGWMLTPLGA